MNLSKTLSVIFQLQVVAFVQVSVCFLLRRPSRCPVRIKYTAIANQGGTESFISVANQSLVGNEFVSFTLRGQSKKQRDVSKGSIRLVTARVVSLRKKPKIQVTFKYHLATDVVKNWELNQLSDGLSSLLGRNSSLGIRSPMNVSLIPWSEWGPVPLVINSATLETTKETWELVVQPSSEQATTSLRRVKKSFHESKKASIGQHDRTKNVLLAPTFSFWQALGLTTGDGKPRSGMSSKIRQCQKFVEILDCVIATQYKDGDKISVVDMGCGRGYLTFALHTFLLSKYTNVESLGIDVRPKLVDEITRISDELNLYPALKFQSGTIQDFEYSRSADLTSTMQVLIALHACDTATDDALWMAISNNFDVIVVAPCCHRELRTQIDSLDLREHILSDILRFGIYRERATETVTDSIRALLLEQAGYVVNVFEFIGGEHTSKNVMISAVKRNSTMASKSTMAMKVVASQKLQSLASLYGIRHQKLATFLNASLTTATTLGETDTTASHVEVSRSLPLSMSPFPPP